MSPKCLQMSLNVSKCLQNVSKMSPNVSIETFSPYRLHQSEIPNALPAEKIRSYWPFLKNILHFHWSNSYSALIVKRVKLTNSSSLPHKVPSYFENWVMWFKGANFWKNEKQKIRQMLLYIFHISRLLIVNRMKMNKRL